MRESMFEEKGRDPGEEVYNTPIPSPNQCREFDTSPEREHEYPPKPVQPTPEVRRLLKELARTPAKDLFID